MKYQKPTRSTRINAGGRPLTSKYASKQQRRRVAELTQEAETELSEGDSWAVPQKYLEPED